MTALNALTSFPELNKDKIDWKALTFNRSKEAVEFLLENTDKINFD